MSIFDKWNKALNVEKLAKELEEAEQNGGSGEYAEVPVGKYEIKIEKMELKESKKGDPMFSAWFRIIEGTYKNQLLFMDQPIPQIFQIKILLRFLDSLDSGIPVKFVEMNQFNDLINDIMEEVDDKLEFLVEFSKSKKEFPVYKIKEVYEK